jgi:ornithine decarboxylase
MNTRQRIVPEMEESLVTADVVAGSVEPDSAPTHGNPQTLAPQLAETYGTPLLVVDCDEVRRRFRALARALPNVDLHYAIKAFPNDDVLRVLAEEGAHFEVASTGELASLSRLGIDTSACLHTHPVKRVKDIEQALEFGVRRFVFGHSEELRKLAPFADDIELALRVGYRAEQAIVQLANKFGCAPDEAPSLLREAANLGIKVTGITFHVGSQSLDSSGHVAAIKQATELLNAFPMLTALDIGGGFPVNYECPVPAIDDYCAPICEALAAIPDHIRIIAEPGRYLVASAVTGVASVMGHAMRDGKRWYYLDDGVYGSFSGRIYDHARYPLWAAANGCEVEPCVVAGPTCDGIDIIDDATALPRLDTGDLVMSGMMGAYTSASATSFNDFPKAKIVALNAQRLRTVED